MLSTIILNPQSPPPDHRSWFNFPPSYPPTAFIAFSATAFIHPFIKIITKAKFNPTALGIVRANTGNINNNTATIDKVAPMVVKIVVYFDKG